MGGLHEGHRGRMKERFLKEGLDSFSDHQVLEMLLFFALPRRDTNEIAHTLIRRFGSLAGVLEAPAELLATVDGIGMHAATLIKSILPIANRYVRARAKATYEACDTVEKLTRYAKEQYVGVHVETAKLVMMDNALHIIDCVKLAEGSGCRARIDTRRIVEITLQYGASMVVLLHNHSGGRAYPSGDDLEATLRLRSVCDAIGVHLLEHLLITEEDVIPVLRIAAAQKEQSRARDERSSV